jgi:hypothetical protein
MDRCGSVRAVTYNKLGSIKGWGLFWQKADKLVREIISPSDLGIPQILHLSQKLLVEVGCRV